MKFQSLGSRARFIGGLLAACFSFSTATQAASTYYVATVGNNGDDSHDGSLGSPWRTIGHGFSQLSAGDTLNIRSGIYRETDLAMATSGTVNNPITVQAYQDETVIINPSYPEFETTGAWTLHDAVTNTYKTTATYSDAGLTAVWEETSGKRVRLVTYSALSNLMSNSESWTTGEIGYVGPGIYKAAGSNVIYIRLQASDSTKIDGVTADAPPQINPNNLKIYICSRDKSLLRHTGNSTNKYWVFNRLQFLFAPTYDTSLGGDSASHMTFTDCVFAAPSFPRAVCLFRSDESFWLFDGCESYGYVARWVAWTDVKHPPAGDKLSESNKVQFASFKDSTGVHDIVYQNGTALDFFDGWNVLPTQGAYNLKWLNNHFRIRDDVIQITNENYNWEFAYNYCEIAGPGRDGEGTAPAQHNAFVHHNIFDTSDFQLWGRVGSGTPTGEAEGLVGKKILGTHSAAGKNPWKIYNNTFLHYVGSAKSGIGEDRSGDASTEVHSFLNNIVLQGNDWYVSRWRKYPTVDEYDYNIYFELVSTPSKSMFFQYGGDGGSNNGSSYNDLAAAKLAVPQWEYNSSQEDPEIANMATGDWRPSSSGPAATGALDLSSRNWPGGASTSWRGAVDPNASTGMGNVGPPGGSGGTAPAAPSDLNAMAVSSSQINLSWQDHAGNETGFNIRRGTTSGSYDPTPVREVGADVLSFTDSDALSPSTTYYYQVKAENSSGESTGSNEAYATTDPSGGGGGTIAFRGAASATTGSGTATTLVLNKPAGVVADDLMLVGISVINGVTITEPDGWSPVETITDTMQLSIYSKLATSSEPSSYTWDVGGSAKKMCGGIVAFSGVNTTSPIQAHDGEGESGSSTATHVTPPITTTGSTTWLVSFFGDRRNGGSTWTASGLDERVDERATSGNNDPSLSIYSEGPTSAGSQSHTGTANGSSPYAGMAIIALQP